MTEGLRRKRPAHWIPDADPGGIIVFVTCCTKDRRPWLADPKVHRVIREVWQTDDRWRVGHYVLMPDHVHFFCAPCPESGSLGNWMGFWRSHVTRALGVGRGSLWQREYWDRQLRRHESYADAWEYVRQNPARAGLVERSEDWAYQGEINVLEWLG